MNTPRQDMMPTEPEGAKAKQIWREQWGSLGLLIVLVAYLLWILHRDATMLWRLHTEEPLFAAILWICSLAGGLLVYWHKNGSQKNRWYVALIGHVFYLGLLAVVTSFFVLEALLLFLWNCTGSVPVNTACMVIGGMVAFGAATAVESMRAVRHWRTRDRGEVDGP